MKGAVNGVWQDVYTVLLESDTEAILWRALMRINIGQYRDDTIVYVDCG